MRPADELLYDSEASLRLVDHAIEELSSTGADLDRDARSFLEQVLSQPGGFAELSRTLLRAYGETLGIVVRLRESCGILDGGGVDKLQQMQGRVREVSSATEVATTDILDSIGRAVTIAESMQDSVSDTDRVRLSALQNELNGVMVSLQFQDITAQQLTYISSLLGEMRGRVNQIVSIFAPASMRYTGAEVLPEHGTFDPNCSAAPATERQAMADEIFGVKPGRKTA